MPATPGPRERLLAAASRLFYQQGYLATGVNQLIDEAKIAKASFYQHFGSKEELCETYLARSHERWNALLSDFLDRYDDPRERLLGLFDFLKQWKQDVGYRGCAFLNMVAEIPASGSPLREQSARHYDVFRIQVGRLVASYAAADRPDLSNEEQERLAEGLVLLFQGATVSAQNYTDTWPVDTARAVAERLIDC